MARCPPADAYPDLDRARPARRARRAFRLRPRQEGRARSHHLQQIEAHHAGRPRALALDRVGRQVAGRDRHQHRDLRRADRRDRQARRAQAVPLIGFAEAGAGGYFDDGGFPVGKGWDEIALPAGQRRARLCAGDLRRLDAAGLSRRRRHRRVAGRAGAARRPRRGQDQGRRSDGQGAAHARPPRSSSCSRSTPSIATARCRCSDVVWIARIVWASQ